MSVSWIYRWNHSLLATLQLSIASCTNLLEYRHIKVGVAIIVASTMAKNTCTVLQDDEVWMIMNQTC